MVVDEVEVVEYKNGEGDGKNREEQGLGYS